MQFLSELKPGEVSINYCFTARAAVQDTRQNTIYREAINIARKKDWNTFVQIYLAKQYDFFRGAVSRFL